jgi:enolase-phosphatase E1
MQYILTDIEGTTTSISFVYDTLFPCFLQRLESFISRHAGDKNLSENIRAVQQTILEEENREADQQEAVQKLMEWTKNDRKHPALKNIQGMVWREAYESGDVQGHLYDDVPPALAAWKEQGISIGIYSSGSEEAQRLIFGYSVFGDLTHFIAHYFDTRVGHKREPSSYKNISGQLGLPAHEILFLSDIEAELDAAASAGFQTMHLAREGTSASAKHRSVQDFSGIISR